MVKIAVCILVVAQSAMSGIDRDRGGARAHALGGAYVGLADDVWGIDWNPGALVLLRSRELSLSYAPRPFDLPELSTSSLALGVPTSIGVGALEVRTFGFDLYREISASFAFARVISGIGVGIGVSYDRVAIARYGAAGTMALHAGISTSIVPKLRTGLSFRNLNSATIGSAKEKLPQRFTIGIAYLPLPTLRVLVDYEKDSGFDPESKFGCEYVIADPLTLRIGIADASSQSSGGIGLKYDWLTFDYALLHHPELGWTHEASLTIEW